MQSLSAYVACIFQDVTSNQGQVLVEERGDWYKLGFNLAFVVAP